HEYYCDGVEYAVVTYLEDVRDKVSEEMDYLPSSDNDTLKDILKYIDDLKDYKKTPLVMEKKIKEQLVRKYYSRYLPYNVRVLFDNTTEGILCGIRTGIFDLEVIEEYDNDTPIIKTWCSSDTKLILRRFDLSKEIEHDGEK